MNQKWIILLIVLLLLLSHFIMSALALMQARRLKNISRTNKGVTWTYMLATFGLGIGAIITVLTMDS